MEFILFDILYISLELYTGVIVLYVIIHLLRKKKLPWKILLIESGCILLFFYLRYLVDQHELIVFGDYTDPQDYGEGIANMSLYTYNLAFVTGLFLISQLVFWAFFTEKFKNLNKQKQEGEIDIDELLNQQKPE